MDFENLKYSTFGEHEQSVSYSKLSDIEYLENGVKLSVYLNRRLIKRCIY